MKEKTEKKLSRQRKKAESKNKYKRNSKMANTIIGAVNTLIVVILNLFTKKEQKKI